MSSDSFVRTDALGRGGIPSVLISSKCDVLPEARRVDPSKVEQQLRQSFRRLNTLQINAGDPETHKRGVSMILREILSRPTGKTREEPSTERFVLT